MSFFGVNPFASPVGQKIEQATDETLPSENWTLNLEICDLINDTESGARDAIKAIRKRFTSQPKNYKVVMHTLTVLETCVKNCGKGFHVLACSKDFIQELVKLIGPKNDPPPAVQEKVLSLIQSWADAFRHQPDLSGVSQVYADLKHKGIEFPMTDMDTMAPIITPQRTVAAEPHPTPSRPSPSSGGTSPRKMPQQQQQQSPGPKVSSGSVNLTPEQRAKLLSELDMVESNAKVFTEMLTELTPAKEHEDDLQLLQELNATCRAMQERVVELVARISDDTLTAELLRINDNLNNLFVRYDRHMSKVKAARSPQKSPPLQQPQSPVQKKPAEVSLIDLDDPPSTQLSNIAIASDTVPPVKKSEDADFDMFAQSRTATYEGAKSTGSTYKDNTDPDVVRVSLGEAAQLKSLPQQKDSDFDEMERWLNEQPTGSGAAVAGKPEESITSSEFDRFLAERAAVPENLPTITAATGSAAINIQQSQSQQRTLSREEKENKMFAL